MGDDGWVLVDAPAWLWGSKVSSLFEAAGMQMRRTAQSGHVRARTSESYLRTAPDLVRLIRATGPDEDPRGMEQLVEMSDDAIDAEARGSASSALNDLRVETSSDLTRMISSYQLATAAVAAEELPDQAHAVMESLRAVTVEGGARAFDNPGVFAVQRSDALLYRTKLMSVLLRVQHDPRLAAGDLTHLTTSDSMAFAAAAELHTGLYLLDPYVGVLMGALTPAVWGFSSSRGRGAVIYSFGRQLAGGSAYAPELLRTLPLQGADRVTEFSELPADAVPAALRWWADALNDLFAVVSDWAVFSDATGHYSAAAQLEAVATVEQMFRRVLSIQANHHDLNARRVLLFTVLDTLEALTGRPIEKHCSLQFAEATVKRLAEIIPASAHPLLLARAARAVEALREVQDGFFIREPDGTILSEPSAGRSISAAEAAAQYLKLLRNATHGHGTIRARQVEITETLLARHDGRIPHDVALLGWVYLLDVLARPAALRKRLHARSSRPPR